MGRKTAIEWCDSTVNPTAGCDGCELWGPKQDDPKHCYAAGIHTRFSGGKTYPGPFEQVALMRGRMVKAAGWSDLTGKERPGKPWLSGRPRTIFIGDMADNFSDEVPSEYLYREVVLAIEGQNGKRHTWVWVTKRPRRICDLLRYVFPKPSNLVAVTSATSADTLLERKGELEKGSFAVRGVSIEPLLERIPSAVLAKVFCRKLIRWVIVGCESGPGRRPCPLEWVEEIVRTCVVKKVPVFVKQLDLRGKVSRDPAEWPEYLRVRQMFPFPVAPESGVFSASFWLD